LLDSLEKTVDAMNDPILSSTVSDAKWVPESKSLVFNGPQAAITKITNLLPTLDVAQPTSTKTNFLVYTPKNQSVDDLLASIKETTKHLQNSGLANPALLDGLNSAKKSSSSNSIVFTADPAALTNIQTLLSTLDVPATTKEDILYVYPVKTADGSKLLDSLEKTVDAMNDPILSTTVRAAKWVPESKSLVFNGPQTAITKITNLLPLIDIPAPTINTPTSTDFLHYTPKYQDGQEIINSLQDTAHSLENGGLSNPALIDTLKSARWVKSTKTIVFTGDPSTLEKTQSLLSTIDVPGSAPQQSETLIYKPNYKSQEQLQTALSNFAKNLDSTQPSDQALIQCIEGAHWVEESNSFIFRGSKDTLDRMQYLLSSLDNDSGVTADSQAGFYIYQLKNAKGNEVIDQLKTVSSSLVDSKANNKNLQTALENLKWLKPHNQLLISGSPSTIDQVKIMIDSFDILSSASIASIAFSYTPVNTTPEELQSSLTTLAASLKSDDLANQDLVNTIEKSKIIPSSQSVLFTGTEPTIAQLKPLLNQVDTSSSSTDPSVNGANILVYHITKSEPKALLSSMTEFANHFIPDNETKKQVTESIEQAKYNSGIHSFIFTGHPKTLEMVKSIAEKFDVSKSIPLPRAAATNFIVYNPKSLSGPELIKILDDFMETLKDSNLSNPELFDTIHHLKYIEKTNSLIITGIDTSMQQVVDLLTRFDVGGTPEGQQPLAPIPDTTHFLVYKLQYHQGIEILTALKEVAASMASVTTSSDKPLIDAITSLQWVEVTNSLIATGEPSSLAKVKSLIENVDVPLRQVFIEVLVVETSLFNSQNFGLQWGSQLQYMNKTIGAMGNFPIPAPGALGDGAQVATIPLAPSITNTTASTPPMQGGSSTNQVPFGTGFDLGVIGDLIFHKGKSFLSLGSLINALQVDSDATVVMNPKIITQDGHTSTIFIGQNIPFTGSFVSNVTTSTVTTSNIEYRDVGVNLTITPTLGTNNIITLEIAQDISEQVPSTTSQGTSVSGVQTTHTTMNTRVHVPDNHFLVLSGMIQNAKTNFRSGLPCLGGLPVVGALFAQNDRSATKTNVIIFIRPIIIHSFEDYDRITEEEEAMFKENAVHNILKEEFDQATEMIKALSNE
ncbi:MAG: secretin N-terminal domain-containing protein, partial [Chlamydiia bacterium]